MHFKKYQDEKFHQKPYLEYGTDQDPFPFQILFMIENLTVSEVHHQGLLSVLKNNKNADHNQAETSKKCFHPVTSSYLNDKNVPLGP